MTFRTQLTRHHLLVLTTLTLIVFTDTTARAQLRNPQLVTYTVQKPDEVEKGKLFNINILLSVEPDWYIYAPTGTNAAQGMIETKIVFTLPKGISRVGKMEVPEPLYKEGFEVLQGNIVMHQAFKAAKPGAYTITGKITYQSCSTDVCLLPVTEKFTTTLHIK